MLDDWGQQDTVDTNITARQIFGFGHVGQLPTRCPTDKIFIWLPLFQDFGHQPVLFLVLCAPHGSECATSTLLAYQLGPNGFHQIVGFNMFQACPAWYEKNTAPLNLEHLDSKYSWATILIPNSPPKFAFSMQFQAQAKPSCTWSVQTWHTGDL